MRAEAMERVAVLGTGGMGTTLALLLSRSDCSVKLWGRRPELVEECAKTRVNRIHLPGVRLPEAIRITANAEEALDQAEGIVLAIPSAFVRATLERLSDHAPRGVPVLSVVKGIERDTFARPTQIIRDVLGPRPVSVLSGPSHAEEIAQGLPASVVVAGEDVTWNLHVQGTLNSEQFRVYTNTDPLGVELAGALKNILGVAAGISDGLGLGDNAKAALLTRGLAEITRFGVGLGARPETFQGLAGVGDVITTCCSRFGRNRALGEWIGRGATLAEVQAGMNDVAEGVYTTQSVDAMARARGIEMPITREVSQILFEGKAPRDTVTDLMMRTPKGEWPW